MSKPAEKFTLASSSSAASKTEAEPKLKKLNMKELEEAFQKARDELNEARKQQDIILNATKESQKLASKRSVKLARKYTAKRSELTNINSRLQKITPNNGSVHITIIGNEIQLAEEAINDLENEGDTLLRLRDEMVFYSEKAYQQVKEAIEKIQQLDNLFHLAKVRDLREKAIAELSGLRGEIQKKSEGAAVDANSREQAYINELEDFVQHENPLPHADIDYIWVLSARHTFLRRPIDAANLKDPSDDINRVLTAIMVAQGVTAARMHKTIASLSRADYLFHGPTIIYNGSPLHNFDLGLESLGDGTIVGYPFEKFTILPLDPVKIHTGGQFLSVKNAKLPFQNNAAFALVTHAYHFPRVSRMIDHPSQMCIERGSCYAFLVDRTLEAPGALLDVRGEVLLRSTEYIKKGFLAKDPSRRIINKPLDQTFQSAAGDLAFKEAENRAKSELLFSYPQHQNTIQFGKKLDPVLHPIEIIREYLGGQAVTIQNTVTKKINRRNSIA